MSIHVTQRVRLSHLHNVSQETAGFRLPTLTTVTPLLSCLVVSSAPVIMLPTKENEYTSPVALPQPYAPLHLSMRFPFAVGRDVGKPGSL